MKKLQIENLKLKIHILNFKYFFFLLCIFTIYYLLFTISAKAENLSSPNFQIQMGNVNMGAGAPTSASYKLGLTGGQTAPGLYTSTGYKVRAGFWYVKSIIPFSFTISNLSIALGALNPGTPSTQTNTLTVSAGGAGGYQVTARENEALTSSGGANTIPDTTCNGGADTCDETTAKPWTDNTKYGFGYNMSGNDIPATFADSTSYYRPFPSLATQESAAVVMSSANVGKSRQATVTYKVNISGTQAAGSYENYIIFVATPTY